MLNAQNAVVPEVPAEQDPYHCRQATRAAVAVKAFETDMTARKHGSKAFAFHQHHLTNTTSPHKASNLSTQSQQH
eukprot:6468736-Amphidinium_carterae.1